MIDFFAYLGYFLLALNLFLYLKGFAKYGKAFKVFTIYNATMFVIEIVTEIMSYKGIHNLFLSHFYFLFQFLILSYFYYLILSQMNQKKIVLLGTVLVMVALSVQYFLLPDLFYKFNLFEIFITSFTLILYSTFHLYNMLSDNKTFYYINLGVLIYLFGSTILFLTGNLVASLSAAVNTLTWTLNAFLYVIYQLFILFEWKKSFAK